MGFVDAITAPITSVANSLGNAWNDFTGQTAADMSISAAKANTEKQIAWERERATNAHQWEIKDLEKAGLNPILSAGGSGAATGGITPQMPDLSTYKGTGGALMDLAMSAQSIKNDTDRVLNETKETNSNLSLKKSEIMLNMEKKINLAAEKKWIDAKTATEMKQKLKLQSEMDLANSQIMLNEQMRGRAEFEMKQIEKEIDLLNEEIKNAPNKRKRYQLENDLTEKENQMYYIREIVNETAKLGAMGMSIYGAFQANKAISAYKANQNRTQFTEIYNGKGKQIGERVSYYK